MYCGIPGHILRPEHNFDYRTNNVHLPGATQGDPNYPYSRPVGTYRHALDITRFGNQNWINDNNSGWVVAYHGIRQNHIEAIAGICGSGSFDLGRAVPSPDRLSGIWLTPDFETALSIATTFHAYQGIRCKVVIQCRVNIRPYPNREFEVRPDMGHPAGGTHWLFQREADVRPYGVSVLYR